MAVEALRAGVRHTRSCRYLREPHPMGMRGIPLSLEENPSTLSSEKAQSSSVTKVDFVLHLEAFKTVR